MKDSTFLADCHHNAGTKGPQARHIFPCELRSSCVVAHHLGRMVTPYSMSNCPHTGGICIFSQARSGVCRR